ncbi:MAG: hypothetical protein IMW89_20915 [Ktedonobacteraceae bacterium]|nr:hypothetical protein [Ktedonobacteraceae bacterium]
MKKYPLKRLNMLPTLLLPTVPTTATTPPYRPLSSEPRRPAVRFLDLRRQSGLSGEQVAYLLPFGAVKPLPGALQVLRERGE